MQQSTHTLPYCFYLHAQVRCKTQKINANWSVRYCLSNCQCVWLLRVLGKNQPPATSKCSTISVLARNEEFSKIAVIKFFFTVLKKKIQLSVGGFCGGNFEIYHANQQFSTCMLIDTHVNKRERYTISPVHDCACYCMHTCLLMLIKIQIENTQSTLESKNISFMGVLKKL